MPEEAFQQPLSLEEVQAKTEKYVLDTYRRAPVAFFFGQGDTLYDSEQRPYLDFLSGIAVTNLGHGEADIIEAIRAQADRLMHTSNLYYNEEQARLAEVLVENSFAGKVFFCNSGTEANEAAFKLARRYGQEVRDSAHQIVALEGSFHGRTTAGMSLTGQSRIHEGFGPLVPGIKHVPPNDTDALEQALTENDTCAFFAELVQGEGGVRPLETDYVQAARELCTDNDVLFIVDDVQAGVGRTGKLFSFEHYEIEPDAMTLAKGLGAGFPIGALVVAEQYTQYLGRGQHGATFGGNHLACRVAYETLRIILGRELLPHVQAISSYMFQRLRGLQTDVRAVIDVRGLGLMIGIELDRDCGELVSECRDRGLLINVTDGATIRLLPPLTLSLERAAEGLDILEREIRRFTV